MKEDEMKPGALDVHEHQVGEFRVVTTVFEVTAHVELLAMTPKAKKTYVQQLAISIPTSLSQAEFEKQVQLAVYKYKTLARELNKDRIRSTRTLDFLRESLPEEAGS
ncbi:MAG: hypothetical protein V3T54_01340 [Acidobacteriota bacterium]